MLMKFPHSDPNCLHIFNSTKTIPPTVGILFHKQTDQIKQNPQKQVLECPNGGQVSKKNRIFRNPRRVIDKNINSGRGFPTKDYFLEDSKNGVLEKEGTTQDSLLDNPDERTQKKDVLNSEGAFTEVVVKLQTPRLLMKSEKNDVLGTDKVNQNGYLGKSDGRIENGTKSVSEMRTSSLVDNMQTKCSTKWARYGGYIPVMLEALELTSDLDTALKPWEKFLTNKERSILLKEQLRWERATEIFEWFKKKCYEVNVIHYNIMIRILGKARRWYEVESLWGEMRERGIKPINSTYGTLIDVYNKGGMREKAMEWLEFMNERKMEPDEVTMGIIIQMYKKAGDYKTAEEFFKKWSNTRIFMESGNSISGRKNGIVQDSDSNLRLSTHTYNTLIDTYGKGGKLQEATETFEKMLKKGIIPTTVTFNSLIHMFGNNGQLREVSTLMGTMTKVKCSPDTRTYNILISLHAKHNNIELASKYFKIMKGASVEPDSVTYRTLLYAFAIRHMVFEAQGLVSEMDERKLEIDEYAQSSLTRMYIEAELIEKSWSWFQRFHLSGNMTSDCYSATIDAFGDRGYILEAEKVFNCCLEQKKLTVLVFNVMIKAYGISNKFDEACLLFDSMMEKHGIFPDRCSYNSLVQMLASADMADNAKSYLMKMQEAGFVIDCIPYSAVISSYVKLGQADMAVRLYEEMIGYGIKPDVIVFGVLINAFADTGCVKEATYYLNAMINLGLSMNDFVRKSLIKLYTKVGYLKEAQEAYNLLQSFGVVHDVYSANCMIDLYSERSMVSEAEEIFENMKQNGIANEFTYAMMLCMYRRNGRFVEGYWIARKMRELGFMTDLLSYNNVLGLYASDGRFKEAAATFHGMQKSEVQPDDCTFKSLGIILLKCGVPKDAIENLELKRKKDTERGVQAWISTLSLVIDVSDDNGDCLDDI